MMMNFQALGNIALGHKKTASVYANGKTKASLEIAYVVNS